MCEIYFEIVKQKNIGIAKAILAKHQQFCVIWLGLQLKLYLKTWQGKKTGKINS